MPDLADLIGQARKIAAGRRIAGRLRGKKELYYQSFDQIDRWPMLQYSDLIRLATLIKIAAKNAKAFSDTLENREVSKVTDAVNRIELAANDLIEIGQAHAVSAET